jgi:hypothetical protein
VTVDDVRRLYDYGYWANRKLFQVPGNVDLLIYDFEARASTV